jgi:hypothetical protein
MDRNVVGSSILMYARDPVHHNLYFLLGRERLDDRYSDSNTWSDFSGRTQVNAEGNMETPSETAAREAWEETAAVVRFQRHESLPIEGPDALRRLLDDGSYALRLTFISGHQSQYVTYVVETPFEPEVTDRFYKALRVLRLGLSKGRVCRALIRTGLQDLFGTERHPAIHRISKACDPVFTEKTSLRYFGLPMLQRACEREDGMVINRIDGCQFIRPSFLTRLRVILHHILQGRMDLSRTRHVAVALPPAYHGGMEDGSVKDDTGGGLET